MSTVHHQEYLNSVYTQQVFVMLVLSASASETCRVRYQINLRNSASRCLSLYEYITRHGPLHIKV
jgi:hypothetical protein